MKKNMILYLRFENKNPIVPKSARTTEKKIRKIEFYKLIKKRVFQLTDEEKHDIIS